MLDDSHFVLRERTGFVRADNLRTAERFHRGQFADNRVFLRHGGHADGQHHRDNRRQALGNCGNRQRYRQHKRVK